MTDMTDRERAFEAQFARDAELQFKVAARRNKLLGLWAAERLGLAGEAADEYARSVVAADFEEAGDEDVIRKVHRDLAERDPAVTEHAVRQALAGQAETARAQIMGAM